MDFCLCIFILSAVDPSLHEAVMRRLWNVLKPGGGIMFRDYALYDLTMMRVASKPGHYLGDHIYARSDGTTAYYFTKEYFNELATKCGFAVVQNEYCCVNLKNRKTGLEMYRIWLQSTIIKVDT